MRSPWERGVRTAGRSQGKYEIIAMDSSISRSFLGDFHKLAQKYDDLQCNKSLLPDMETPHFFGSPVMLIDIKTM